MYTDDVMGIEVQNAENSPIKSAKLSETKGSDRSVHIHNNSHL